MSVDKKKAMQELLGRLEGRGSSSGNDKCCDVSLPWVQLAYRMFVNVDALNMVESVGNVTRRRTVPVIVPKGPGQYVVRWVPAVSGESLAHRYQMEIVELAKTRYTACRDRIDYWSEQGELLKHWDLGFYAEQCDRAAQGQAPSPKKWECDLAQSLMVKSRGKWSVKPNVRDPATGRALTVKQGGQVKFTLDGLNYIERVIVENSIVEDIAGFLVTQGPTRRTSCIRFSYLIPTLDALEASQVDHQMHVRGALKAETLSIVEGVQVPYYVQIGSVLYGGNVELDLCCIGRLSITGECIGDSQCTLSLRRKIAVEALRPILEGDFGAKRSRYRPHNMLEVAIAVISDKPVPLPPATLRYPQLLGELSAKLEAYSNYGVSYQVVALVPRGIEYRDELIRSLQEALGKKLHSVTDTATEFIGRIVELAGISEK